MNIRLLAVAALALPAALLLPVSAANAAPDKPGLPDATLYCGPAYDGTGTPAFTMQTTLDSFTFPRVGADPIWISGNDVPLAYAGKWNFVSFEHYMYLGLATQPVPFAMLRAQPSSTYLPVGGKSFGTKAGMDDVLQCEIVSRWDVSPQPFTIYGPIVLARTS